MTPILWTSIGISIGAVVLFAALGLRRPVERTHLSFACVMAALALFLFFEWQLDHATDVALVIAAKQHQVAAVLVCLAFMLVFVPAYSRVSLPRGLRIALWCALPLLFVANLVTPYGLWFAGEPTLVFSTNPGVHETTVVTPRMGPLQLAFAALSMTIVGGGLVCAFIMYRRRDVRRALMFAFALGLVFVAGAVDAIRDNVGGSWPYVVHYGMVGWGLVMMVQLAHDFRQQTHALGEAIFLVERQSERLVAMLDALDALEHDITHPLETLQRCVDVLARNAPDDPRVQRMERAVARLRQLAHSMPATSARGGIWVPHQRSD